MAEFHHHPDGIVYLRGEGVFYGAALSDFGADCAACGVPAYAGLPAGARERRYLPGRFHALYTADTQIAGGDWPDGDLYLAAIVTLAAAQAAREAAYG